MLILKKINYLINYIRLRTKSFGYFEYAGLHINAHDENLILEKIQEKYFYKKQDFDDLDQIISWNKYYQLLDKEFFEFYYKNYLIRFGDYYLSIIFRFIHKCYSLIIIIFKFYNRDFFLAYRFYNLDKKNNLCI